MKVASALSLGSTSVELVASTASDVGSVRRINEDSFLAASSLFIVADGMGGHEAGDRASASVRSTFEAALASHELLTAATIVDTIALANEQVRAISAGIADASRLSGTTLAGVAVIDAGDHLQWMAFNIGDSRVYQWDGRVLTQLSVDHSAVQELIDLGAITVSEAAAHPDRNVITRAIGAAAIVDADVWLIPMTGTQCFLLCSDGLSKELDDEQIADILASHNPSSAGTIADELVAAAVAAGGADNVTAVVVESRRQVDSPLVESTTERLVAESRVLEDTRPRL